MGTPLEHCYFSSQSLFPHFPFRSAPCHNRWYSIRSGAECFRTLWNTVISLASHYFPSRSAPLRATVVPTERSGTLLTRWEHHWNTVISLASHYFPVPRTAPLRATVVGTALEIFLVPSERSGTLSTMMRTPQEHCDFSS